MKKYTLTLSKDYCQDWSNVDALREIIQNCLDSPETFEYEIEEDSMELTSKNTQLPASTLILGVSGKRGDSNNLGGFGEGYKLSCLILCRNGVDVTIYNGSKKWVPSLEWNDDFETEMLTITETNHSGNDLTFSVSGLTSEEIRDAIDKCLHMKKDLGEFATAPCGSRVFYDQKGELFVGGLYVCDTNLEWTYDLHPSKIKLNRDRKTVDGWDLQGVTSKILRSIVADNEIEASKIVDLAARGSNDTHHMRYYGIPDVGNTAYEKFKTSYGDKAVAAKDWSQRESMVKEGYEEVVVVNSEEYYKMIVDSDEYEEYINSIELEEKEPEDERTPLEMLEECIDSIDIYEPVVPNHFKELLDIFKERGVSFDN